MLKHAIYFYSPYFRSRSFLKIYFLRIYWKTSQVKYYIAWDNVRKCFCSWALIAQIFATGEFLPVAYTDRHVVCDIYRPKASETSALSDSLVIQLSGKSANFHALFPPAVQWSPVLVAFPNLTISRASSTAAPTSMKSFLMTSFHPSLRALRCHLKRVQTDQP